VSTTPKIILWALCDCLKIAFWYHLKWPMLTRMCQNMIAGFVENLCPSAPVLEGRGRLIQEQG